jgi:hypothetical protein
MGYYIMKFSDLTFNSLDKRSYGLNGVYTKVWFPNGYGVSIVRHNFSYGHRSGLYEMAIITGNDDNFELKYDTPITDDVLGYLTEADVEDYMEQVSKLEEFKP